MVICGVLCLETHRNEETSSASPLPSISLSFSEVETAVHRDFVPGRVRADVHVDTMKADLCPGSWYAGLVVSNIDTSLSTKDSMSPSYVMWPPKWSSAACAFSSFGYEYFMSISHEI